MTRTLARRGLAAGLAVSFCTLALAAGPGFWQVATQADFLRGDVDQLSIDEHGRLTLGPEVRRVFDGAVSVVWTLETRPDGTTFLGTGNDGKVFKVGADGNGTLFYDSPELEVHALAAAPNGGLYVGTSPDGRIYRVDANGAATTFFDPDDKYIWSLATDAKGVPVRRHRRQGHGLSHYARRQGRGLLPDQGGPRHDAANGAVRHHARRHRCTRPRFGWTPLVKVSSRSTRPYRSPRHSPESGKGPDL